MGSAAAVLLIATTMEPAKRVRLGPMLYAQCEGTSLSTGGALEVLPELS
jgi:hypothetical protein